MSIRVFLADDHPTLRVGLKALLHQAPDMEVVGEANTGTEALERIRRLQPDVAVLDCELPGLAGPEVAARLQEEGLPVRVLMLSAYTDDHYVYGALDAGAVGYVLKSEAPQVIVEAVRKAAQGESYFSPPVVEKIIARMKGEEPEIEALTDREIEVLRLMAKGWTNARIARELGIRERTVAFHVEKVLAKLGAGNRTEAVVEAIRRGLVEV